MNIITLFLLLFSQMGKEKPKFKNELAFTEVYFIEKTREKSLLSLRL
jgi:hypothetical protein